MTTMKSIILILIGLIPMSIAAAAPPPGTDTVLPFTMLSSDAVLNSSKRVFAHYFYPLPLSIDNLPWTKDYYTVNYLNPHGEGDKFLACGGLLRTRPLPLTNLPNPSANWQMLNMQEEVRMAIARGINGFSFDIMSTADATDANGKLRLMLQAAQAVDPRFKILLMPDMSGLGTDTNKVQTIVKAVYTHPSLYHWSDGRLALAPFASERVAPSAWTAMLNQLKAQGIDIAFIPTFGSLAPSIITPYFSMGAVGMGNFGNPGTPDQREWGLSAAELLKSKRLIFFDGLVPQAYKPQSFFYDEACGSLAYRNAWETAIEVKAEMIQIVTWNDFGESTHVAPATSASGVDSGNGFYDLTGYYATWYHTGTKPVIRQDALYYFHRKEPTTARAPAQSQSTNMRVGQSPKNQIELLAFLKSPGTIAININGKTWTKAAPAGLSSYAVPSAPGIPTFQLRRSYTVVMQFQGKTQIYGEDGLPTGILDLTYWSGSAP